MNESEVWKKSILYLRSIGANVICGCPPGATSYAFKNCTLIAERKTDSPDIIFKYDKVLYICECKGPEADLYKTTGNNENDLQKLTRITGNFKNDMYNKQLLDNYRISVGELAGIKPCICYYSEAPTMTENFSAIVVGKNSITPINW